MDQLVTSVLVRGGDGFCSLISRIAVCMWVGSREYVCPGSSHVCGTSSHVCGMGMSRPSELIFCWYLETSLRFHRAHRASGMSWMLHGMVFTRMGSWSRIYVTLETSGKDAAVELKKEAKDVDP